MADLDRIKRNVAKMAQMNAPESDIDGYIASEGVTLEQVRSHKMGNQISQPTKQPVQQKPIAQPKQQEIIEQPTPMLTGGIEQKVIQNWDSKGRVYYTDEQGNRIKSNVPLSRKIGNKIKATATNIGDWLTTDVGENAKQRRKAVAMGVITLADLALNQGRGLLSHVVGGGLGSGLYSLADQAIEGKFNPKQLAIDTGLGAGLGAGGKLLIDKALQPIAKNIARRTNIAKRRATPIADRMTEAKPQVNQEVIEQPVQQIDDVIEETVPIQQVEEVVESVPPQTEQPKVNLNTLKSNIRANKFKQGNLKDYMVVNKGKKGYKSTIADPISYDIEKSQREFNNIITEISKNPEKLNDSAYMADLENRVQQIVDKTPYGNEAEVATPYWEKFWKAVDDGYNYNEFKLNRGKKAPQQLDDVVPEQVTSDFNNTETDFIEQAKKQILENNLPSYDDAYIYSDNGHGYLRNQIESMRDVSDKYTKLLKNLEEQKNSYLKKAKSEKRIKEINDAYNQRVKEANDSFENSQQNIIKNIDNYKKEIDVIPEQVVETTQTGKMKQSTLAQKANKSDEVAQSIQENPPLYETINNAETIAQAQAEIAQNAEKVHTDIVKKLVDGDKDFSALDVEKTRQLFSELQKQGRFDEATELLELTSKQGSKLGQAVQAFSLWSKTTPDGAMLYAQKLLDKYNKGVRKDLQKRLSEKELRDIGETFQKLNESGLTGRELEVETAKAMKKVFKVVPKTFAQKLDGYRYINMLLSPQSRIKDFILTAKNASDTAIDESIAGVIDYLRTLGSKDKTRYISANPFAGTKAWLQGAKKGFKEGVEDVRYGINTSRSGEVGRYGLPNTPTFKEANFEGGLLDRAKTLIGNPLGSAEKLLRYTLQVPDRMFFEARYASSLANQMKARGVTEPTQDMINRAVEEAKRAVFQEDRLVTKRLAEAAQLADIPIEALENVIGLPQGTLPSASKGLAPFVKTPTNVIAQGAEGLHGLGSGGLQLSKAGNNPELIREAELLMGRGIRGLGELGLGYLVGKGLWDKIKTNIGEEDYYKNEITGLQPSSLVIGDKAISLQNMQNNLPFFTGVGLGQRGLGKGFTNTTDIISEMPALKALGDLYNINKEANYIAKSEDPDKELLKKGSRAARSLGANYLTSLIPVGGWLGELRNDIDPYARELYTPDRYNEGVLQGLGSDAEYLKNRVQNRIPGLSMLLPNRYNSLGQPIMSNNIQNPVARALSQAVNFGVRNYNEPPAEMEEMQRIQDYAMENDITGKITLKFAKPKRYIGHGKNKTRLTNEQYSELTRLYNGKVYDELQFLMNTPEYQSADEKTQIKWVREVMKEKKQEAEQEISDIIK